MGGAYAWTVFATLSAALFATIGLLATALFRVEARMDVRFDRLASELRAGMAELRTELRAEMAELRAEMAELRAEMHRGFALLDQRLTRLEREAAG